MKKLFLATTAFAALIAIPAGAADLRVVKAAPVYKPACAQFGGFYVGGHVGANYYRHQYKDLDGYGPSIDILPTSVTNTKYGWHGGAQAGYSWQADCTVFGVEVDWSWTNVEVSSLHTDGSFPVGFPPDSVNVNSQARWFGTARARTGIVINNLLLYVTGGFAFARFNRDVTFTENNTVPPTVVTFAHGRTRYGWAVGAGTEWAINANWSLKSEFLYLGFEKDEQTFINPTAAIGVQNRPYRFEHYDSMWVSRVGINYRWGSPVVARY